MRMLQIKFLYKKVPSPLQQLVSTEADLDTFLELRRETIKTVQSTLWRNFLRLLLKTPRGH